MIAHGYVRESVSCPAHDFSRRPCPVGLATEEPGEGELADGIRAQRYVAPRQLVARGIVDDHPDGGRLAPQVYQPDVAAEGSGVLQMREDHGIARHSAVEDGNGGNADAVPAAGAVGPRTRGDDETPGVVVREECQSARHVELRLQRVVEAKRLARCQRDALKRTVRSEAYGEGGRLR